MEKPENKHPHLEYLPDFEQLLANYEPSQASIDTLRATRVTLLAGPTAAGRNTAIGKLLKTGEYHYIVSDTTRAPRSNNGIMEQDGVEYWFKSEQEFLDGLRSGRYIEAAIIHNRQVSGVSVREIEATHQNDQIAITDIEVVGAENIHRYKPDALCIFMIPPAFEIWMSRLHGRGEMSRQNEHDRLTSAVSEITMALDKDYYRFIINHEIHDTVKIINAMAHGSPLDASEQQTAKDHAEQLVVDVKLYLGS